MNGNPAENWGVLEILEFIEMHPGCKPRDICGNFVPQFENLTYEKEKIESKVRKSIARLIKQGHVIRVETATARKFVYHGVKSTQED